MFTPKERPSNALELHKVGENDTEKAIQLIKSGVDINARDKKKRTALHLHVFAGHLEIVKILVNSEHIQLEIKNEQGLTPLLTAVSIWGCYEREKSPSKARWEIIKVLLDAKANIFATDNNGGNVLHHLAFNRSQEKKDIEEIINQFANTSLIEAKNSYGWTPLHVAAFNGSLTVVECLLALRANYKPLTNAQETPIDLAKQKNHGEVIEAIYHARPGAITLDLEKEMQEQKKQILELKELVGNLVNLLQQQGTLVPSTNLTTNTPQNWCV